MHNIDNLTYGYTAGSNRLATVTDATANAQGFNPMGGAGYTYDLNDDRMVPIENWKWSATKTLHNEGNATNWIASTTNNSYKQITDTKYYFNNLPKDITVNQGVSNVNKIRFTNDQIE